MSVVAGVFDDGGGKNGPLVKGGFSVVKSSLAICEAAHSMEG